MENVKRRNIALCILFSIITGGLYYLYFFARVTTETNKLSSFKSANGLLAIIFIIFTGGIYSYYWAYKMGQRTGDIDGTGSHGGLYIALELFIIGGILIPILAQSCINNSLIAKQ